MIVQVEYDISNKIFILHKIVIASIDTKIRRAYETSKYYHFSLFTMIHLLLQPFAYNNTFSTIASTVAINRRSYYNYLIWFSVQ